MDFVSLTLNVNVFLISFFLDTTLIWSKEKTNLVQKSEDFIVGHKAHK